jgi:hypothetical protein
MSGKSKVGLAVLIVLVLFPSWKLQSQIVPLRVEPLVENNAGAEWPAAMDEDPFEDWAHFLEHPLLLNEATKEQLQRSGLLPDLLIDRLLLHLQLLGPLLHLNELQAVAGFNPELIRQLKPYVKVEPPDSRLLSNLLVAGKISQDILVRVTGLASKTSSANTDWIGNSQGILIRHRLQSNRWQAGWLAEKDPGETMLRNGKPVFDHSGFHLFYQGKELIKALAIGDFTVNMGQGLLHWQSMAFGKSAEMSWFKRQGAVLRPHRSSGEVNFHRGAAATLQWKFLSFSFFISRRLLSGRVLVDSAGLVKGIGSLSTSGYHRTPGEWAGRKVLRQTTAGGRLSYRWKALEFSLNTVVYRFSLPILPNEEPRNLYDVRGRHWFNASADFSFTRKNIHGFGEVALDANRAAAWVIGLVITPSPTADLFLLTRQVSLRYRTLYANAFMESSSVETERGFFLGLTLRPSPLVRIEAFADIYLYPWLRYRLNAPASGTDYLVQLSYRPHKKTELLFRYRKESKKENNLMNVEEDVIPALFATSRTAERAQLSYLFSSRIKLRTRVEWLRIKPLPASLRPTSGEPEENGFLYYADLSVKHLFFGGDCSFRWQYSDTKSYESRIYAITPYLRPGFGVSAFYGTGSHFWISLDKSLKNNILLAFNAQFSRLGDSFSIERMGLQLSLKLH